MFQDGEFDFAVGKVVSIDEGEDQETIYEFTAYDGNVYKGVVALNIDLCYVGEVVNIRYVIDNPEINEVNVL